ncbi:hypothetical protein [Xenorhabdus bovienii]|uniref:Putative RelE-like protein (RelBE toxin-antitoxin system) n=1 Tax=Xenorhabdus bovienii TaxID=40576 RepID=A0A0B6X4M8_XENBV|nr:hypothetical protein [Xenorhabdus bovienii]CDG89880.1 hypothetical protein XBFFR1_420011 [Xenorhabdus bovienii str. feltiae France]CDG91579.1 hypothetical protein XBFFL1_1650011 [Xenorhabdus bovienii str. feltiae Florida]CDM88106.1 Putative RelE-like protein (RelBE toxin-antitoxin system) [Xenorhabdus bovienii]
MNFKMNNLKKKEMIYDGFEDGFYELNHTIQCPYCDEKITVSVSSLKDLSELDEHLRIAIKDRIKGIKEFPLSTIMIHNYDDLSAMYGIYDCKIQNVKLLAIFAVGERQPARYQVILLEIFKYPEMN